MKNIIIGTAGHIDHGKTTLIKAITGRDTDRLKEEKERGISIELGFTYFDLPSGRRAGIIDVPGHERFIKNMLAGVIGIDIVALVIAADEGIMPQTKEHLDILGLLGLKKGLVVLTKADMVDDEWLSLIKEDITEQLKDTFLEDKPIIPVSSINGMGINKVIQYIDKITEEVDERDITETPRLPVDRVFSITGFGTIVTGTLLAGTFKVGDEVQIFPGNKKSRIRSIQVHGSDSQYGYAGQRVAINLAGLKKADLERGYVVAPINSMQSTMMIDVKLNLLKDSQRIIDNRTRLRLYIGTSEVLCRVVFLDREQLTPGESCFAQLRLEDTIAVKRGDKFIIRFYSPMMTIGGGEVLEPNPPKRKRYDEGVLNELELKNKGEIDEIIEKIIMDKSKDVPSIQEISTYTVIPVDKVENIVKQLEVNNRVFAIQLLKDIHTIHISYYEKLKKLIVDELTRFHNNNQLKPGMLKEELRSRFLGNIKPKLGDSIISLMIEQNTIKQTNEFIALKKFSMTFTDQQRKIKNELEDIFKKNGYTVMKREDVASKMDYKKNDIEQVIDALVSGSVLKKLGEDIIIHKDLYENALIKTKKFIEENGSITVAQLRDILDTNRKLAIALLEEFDQFKITKRLDDKRILY